MLVASDLAGKILLKPRSARQKKLQSASGAAREVQDLLRRRELLRAVPARAPLIAGSSCQRLVAVGGVMHSLLA
eukprot:2331598-Prymnesium_polylepis.1